MCAQTEYLQAISLALGGVVCKDCMQEGEEYLPISARDRSLLEQVGQMPSASYKSIAEVLEQSSLFRLLDAYVRELVDRKLPAF